MSLEIDVVSEESLVERLIHSPRLSLHAQKIQDFLLKEREKRQRFYDEISEIVNSA